MFQAPAEPTTTSLDDPSTLEWQSPGAGQWIDGPGDTIRLIWATLDYDVRGNAVVIDELEGTFQYDHASDTISGAFILTERDLAGQVTGSIPRIEVTATRIGVRRV